jgi:prolipoprotein diacylglyceryltransferase
LVMFVILLEIRKTDIARKIPGFTAVCFLAMYSAFRFSVDFLRVYPTEYYGLAFGQWVFGSLFVILMVNSLFDYWYYKRK